MLGSWHRAEQLRAECTVVVYDRPGSVGGRPSAGFDCEWVRVPQLDISSTDIRARVAAGRPIDGLVPPAVIEYIGAHGLYMVPDEAIAR
jgi:nicotinate-nucleotide adenylyltransferase